MSFAEIFLPEFEYEMKGTRSILELVPDSLLSWKAHESLNTVGWVASHLVDTVSWTKAIMEEPSFDIAPVGGQPHESPVFGSAAELVAEFDANLAIAKELIGNGDDAAIQEPWAQLQGGKNLFTMPRAAVVKSFLLNHIIHHRAFLVAYLRMNDIECPGLYS